MKKTFFSIISVLAGMSIYAQFSAGMKTGPNFSSLTGDSVGNNKYKLALHIGSFINYSFNDNFSVQGELLFSAKGAKSQTHFEAEALGVNAITDVKATYNLNYIDIPIMFQATLNDGVFFNAGIQPSFLLSARNYGKTTFSTNFLGIKVSKNFNETNEDKLGLKYADVGVVIGTGYQAKSDLNVGLRANIGLGDIDKNNLKTNNLLFQAAIGYTFGKRKSIEIN